MSDLLCNAKRIAITGKARSGKTELSHYAWMLYGFKEFDFSAVLKDEFHRLFPHIPRDPKPRAYYQKFGQWLREIDPDIWVKMTMAKVHEYCFEDALNKVNHKPKVLVNGVRQPNEYRRLKDEGFVIIRVNASDDLRIERAEKAGDVFTEADLSHDTEMHIDTFEVDYEINNVGTIGDMYDQFDTIMRELGVKAVSSREIMADAFNDLKVVMPGMTEFQGNVCRNYTLKTEVQSTEENEKYWILEYYRYGCKDEYEADSKEEALRFGCHQEDEGNLSMYRLLDPDGNEVMDSKELSHYYVHVY